MKAFIYFSMNFSALSFISLWIHFGLIDSFGNKFIHIFIHFSFELNFSPKPPLKLAFSGQINGQKHKGIAESTF